MDSCEEHGPADVCGVSGPRRFVVPGRRQNRRGTREFELGHSDTGPTDGHHCGAELGVGREDAMVTVPVHTWGRDETSEALKELERGEMKLGTAVLCGPWEPIDEPSLGRG